MNVGDLAPQFELRGVAAADSTERLFESSELAGRPAVLAFYPADQSVVCTLQLAHYAENLPEMTDLEAVVWAISPQSVDSHVRWQQRRGGRFGFPLLSDEDKSVGRSFGVLGLLDLYRRFTFVLDRSGTITWIHRSLAGGLTYPTTADIAEQLRRLD